MYMYIIQCIHIYVKTYIHIYMYIHVCVKNDMPVPMAPWCCALAPWVPATNPSASASSAGAPTGPWHDASPWRTMAQHSRGFGAGAQGSKRVWVDLMCQKGGLLG